MSNKIVTKYLKKGKTKENIFIFVTQKACFYLPF